MDIERMMKIQNAVASEVPVDQIAVDDEERDFYRLAKADHDRCIRMGIPIGVVNEFPE